MLQAMAYDPDTEYNVMLNTGLNEQSIQAVALLGKEQGLDFQEVYGEIIGRIKLRKKTPENVYAEVSQVFENPETDDAEAGNENQDVHTDDVDLDYNSRLVELRQLLLTSLKEEEINEILLEIREIKLRQNAQNVSEWMQTPPDTPDQIITDTLDTGDKLAIIGSSKMRKSFFMVMLMICIAAGRDFLNWCIPKPRRVVLIQLEIQSAHFHKRIRNVAKALGIKPADLGDRFHVINCRGLGVEGQEGIELIGRVVEGYRPELICFDPLYKIAIGAENAIEDAKLILKGFDELIENTGAAVAYVHHDPKGQSGDRDIRDRGAGSNVIGRDYDACITLTPHVSDPDAAVIETMLRNYRPQEPFTALWIEDEETGGYRFESRSDIIPEKKTSKTRKQAPDLPVYLPAAVSILNNEEMEVASFKESFKKQTGLSDNRIKDFLAWATSGGNPHIITREDRGKGLHKKWVKMSKGDGNV